MAANSQAALPPGAHPYGCAQNGPTAPEPTNRSLPYTESGKMRYVMALA